MSSRCTYRLPITTHYLQLSGFSPVLRDDRLLDIWPSESLNKGIELWEKWGDKNIHFIRVFVDLPTKQPEAYSLPRKKIEQLLLLNHIKKAPQSSTLHSKDFKNLTYENHVTDQI